MATTKKDLRVYLSENDRIVMQQIVTLTASVETILAHNPDLVPLDEFLDYSSFVHRWMLLYSFDLYQLNPISYSKYQNLVKQLKNWHEDFKKNIPETDNNAIILLTQALQKAVNLNVTFSVGKSESE